MKKTKRCPDCGLTKSADDFSKGPSKSDGLRTYCKVCDNKRSRESYTGVRKDGKIYLPPSGIPEPGKTYATSPCDICDKIINQRGPNHTRCRDCADLTKSIRTSIRRSCSNHKELSLPKKELTVILRRFVHATICPYCGRNFSESVTKSIDHVVPLASGGKTLNDNIAICCFPCNRSKQDLSFQDWLSLCTAVCKNNGILIPKK